MIVIKKIRSASSNWTHLCGVTTAVWGAFRGDVRVAVIVKDRFSWSVKDPTMTVAISRRFLKTRTDAFNWAKGNL